MTAGATAEPIDPVRFLSNFSTGTMGFEIAKACREKGFDTCLISGTGHIAPPVGVETVKVTTTREMRAAVLLKIKNADCLIMAAAVCDYRPAKEAAKKIKKKETLTLRLIKNPDILAEAGKQKGLVRIGFALETDDTIKNAKKKLKAKKLDLIAANEKGKGNDPFGEGKKDFVVIDKELNARAYKGISKREFAKALAKEAERLIS